MDNNEFIASLAQYLDADPKYAETLLNDFAQTLRESASNLDSIALPGFGNFVSIKESEKVVVDNATGLRTLLPPHIKVEFVASANLKKQVGI